MRWGHTRVIDDFGTLVTDRSGGTSNYKFRIPLGVLPASSISQAALAFMTETVPNPGITAQGELALMLEIGTAVSLPPVTDDASFAPLAIEQHGECSTIVIGSVNDALTNRVYELKVLAPAQPALVPIYLKVAASFDPASTEPTVWSFISSCIVSLVLGTDDTDENARRAAEIERQLADIKEQRLLLETGKAR